MEVATTKNGKSFEEMEARVLESVVNATDPERCLESIRKGRLTIAGDWIFGHRVANRIRKESLRHHQRCWEIVRSRRRGPRRDS